MSEGILLSIGVLVHKDWWTKTELSSLFSSRKIVSQLYPGKVNKLNPKLSGGVFHVTQPEFWVEIWGEFLWNQKSPLKFSWDLYPKNYSRVLKGLLKISPLKFLLEFHAKILGGDFQKLPSNLYSDFLINQPAIYWGESTLKTY